MKQDFRDLVVWQKAIAFVTEVYRATQSFPNEEKFGLTSQLRRASVSIPSNIAEGQGRLTRGEFGQFLGHAKGSICEVETQLIIAHITLAPKKLIRTRRASEGSASEPSLARRVSMCKDAKLSCRGNNLGYLNDPQPLLEKLHAVARGLNGLLNSLTPDHRQPPTDHRPRSCPLSVVSEDTRPLNSQPLTDNRQPPTDNRQPTTDN